MVEKVKKRMGRPRLENPNSVTQTFTTSTKLKKQIEDFAQTSNKTTSNIIRTAIKQHLNIID
jgi:predicted transcriptional regulator